MCSEFPLLAHNAHPEQTIRSDIEFRGIGLHSGAEVSMRLVAAPAACRMTLQRPNDGAANAQKLDEQTFMGGDNSNYGAMFANKIMVECP